MSACATRATERRLAEQSVGARRRAGQEVRVIDGGPEQATAVFTALFGGDKPKPRDA
jgi:hypothetical protein